MTAAHLTPAGVHELIQVDRVDASLEKVDMRAAGGQVGHLLAGEDARGRRRRRVGVGLGRYH